MQNIQRIRNRGLKAPNWIRIIYFQKNSKCVHYSTFLREKKSRGKMTKFFFFGEGGWLKFPRPNFPPTFLHLTKTFIKFLRN